MAYNRQIKNAIITGGAGFIGSHLVEALLNIGVDRITVLDNFSEGSLSNLYAVSGKIKIQKLDITLENWQDILFESNYDYIFHFAGNANVQTSVDKPDVDYYLNLHPTFKLLEAIRRLKWPGCLIYSSSAAVYGNPASFPIQETDPSTPLSPYGVSKLAAERYLTIYSQLYNIKAASIRAASVYGPRLKKQVIYDMLVKITRNPKELVVFGDGTQTRDFIFVKDVAQAAIDIALKGELNGETYNVATGKSHSILHLAETITNMVGVNPEFILTGDLRAGEPINWKFDIQKLNDIGFYPSFSLQEGIAHTCEWFRSNCHHAFQSKPVNNMFEEIYQDKIPRTHSKK